MDVETLIYEVQKYESLYNKELKEHADKHISGRYGRK